MAAMLAGRAPTQRFALGQNHEMNVTPFVDVMLVLLIIFMVAAPLATNTLPLNLPPITSGPTPPKPPILLMIDKSGRITAALGAANGATQMQPISLDALPALMARTGGDRRQQILVEADASARYGQFVAVMNRLQEAGYYHVGLVGKDARQAP